MAAVHLTHPCKVLCINRARSQKEGITNGPCQKLDLNYLNHTEQVQLGCTMSASVMYCVWNKGGQCTGYYTVVQRIHYSLWSWNVIDRCLLFNPIASFSSVPIVTFFVLTPITRIIFDSSCRSLATLPFLLYLLKEVIIMVYWSYEIIYVEHRLTSNR